jgi:hypothetical protein
MLTITSPVIGTNGLAAYYPFDGNANDASGNGNNGVTNGVTVVAGKFGDAFYFEGNDYVEVPHSTSLNLTSRTYSAWIKFSAAVPGWAGIVVKAHKSSETSDVVGAQMNIVSQKLACEVFPTGSSQAQVFGSRLLNDGNWHHVASVVDQGSSNVTLYVDGTYEAQQQCTWLPTANLSNAVPVLIGVDRERAMFFTGVIDEVRIYNRALSALEIQDLYIMPSLVAYYPFDGNANDASMNGNHATVHGTVSFVPGVRGGAAHFGSGGDYVECNSTTVGNFGQSNFTISCWFRSVTGGGIIGKRPGCECHSMFDLRVGRSNLGGQNPPVALLEVGGGGSCPYVEVPVNYADAVWHNVVVRRNGNSLAFYTDGLLAGVTNTAGVVDIQNTVPLRIGRSACTGTDPTPQLVGEIDEVRVYNRALSGAEIAVLANVRYAVMPISVQKSGANLVLTWPFGALLSADELTGTWTPVAGATSPWTNPPSQGKKFYRLKQ